MQSHLTLLIYHSLNPYMCFDLKKKSLSMHLKHLLPNDECLLVQFHRLLAALPDSHDNVKVANSYRFQMLT